MVDMWRCENRRVVLSTRIGDVTAAQLKNSKNGNTADFYSFDFSDWVNIVALTPNQEMVFIRQYRFGTGRVELEIPGGAIEKGEDPLAAGLRELQEETGYGGGRSKIIGDVCPNPAIQGNRCYTILVEGAEKIGDQQLDEMEDIEVTTLSLHTIEDLVDKGEISHGLVMNALYFYCRQREK